MAAIAGRVECRRRLGQVIANNDRFAYVPVTVGELVVRQANGARVVRELGVLERPSVQRDSARLLSARISDAAVKPPKRGQPRIANRFADGARRTSQGGGCLREVVLHQPRLGKRRANRHLVFASKGRGAQEWRQQLRGFRTAALYEGGTGTGYRRLKVS